MSLGWTDIRNLPVCGVGDPRCGSVIRRACDSLSTLAAAFYSSGGSSFMIADAGVDRLAVGGKNRGDVAAAAGKIFVKVPARRLQRALAGGPFVDGCGFGPFIGCMDRTGRRLRRVRPNYLFVHH